MMLVLPLLVLVLDLALDSPDRGPPARLICRSLPSGRYHMIGAIALDASAVRARASLASELRRSHPTIGFVMSIRPYRSA